MRKAVFITVAFAVLGGSVNTAKAHFLYHKKHLTVQQKVNYFKLSITHDRNAIQSIHSVFHSQRREWYNHNYNYVRQLRTSLNFHKSALIWDRHLLRYYASKLPKPIPGSVVGAICYVFGPYCSQALSVSECESHHSTVAVNGQYYGLFQMGSNERLTYGDSSSAVGQAQAAYRYFNATGRDWSPWSCKP